MRTKKRFFVFFSKSKKIRKKKKKKRKKKTETVYYEGSSAHGDAPGESGSDLMNEGGALVSGLVAVPLVVPSGAVVVSSCSMLVESSVIKSPSAVWNERPRSNASDDSSS